MTDIALIKERANSAVKGSIRLPRDANGNPRFYIPVFSFVGADEKWFRPAHCSKYRGKQYGAGWVFQSYNLQRCVDIAYELQYDVKIRD